jgi:hypothetical protein
VDQSGLFSLAPKDIDQSEAKTTKGKTIQIAQKLRYRADAVQAGHGIAGGRELDL